MPISSEQIKLLESYRDKAYITSILCSQSSEHFSFLRSIVNIPLILSSSTMTVLNSMDGSDTGGTNNNMKYANIVLNAWTSLILSLVGNFKLPEQDTNFAQIQVKMNKQLDYAFPNFIKNRVKKIYSGKKVLPNILNCEISFIKVDEF